MTNFFFPQYEDEPFWNYYQRFENTLVTKYRLEIWEMCEVIYDGLNMHTREIVESMFNGEFRFQHFDEAWSFFGWLSRDTYEWDHVITTF